MVILDSFRGYKGGKGVTKIEKLTLIIRELRLLINAIIRLIKELKKESF